MIPCRSLSQLRRRRVMMVAVLMALVAGLIGAGFLFGPESKTNRLAGELSPYLLQHADNPVDWYPWGREAIDRARREQKPIFLSVGYSSCYWCHVMERRVFSDPEIARFLNAHFISVKVDREERPDIDELYMTATQLLSRAAGWPNSVFLTPDMEPFYAGTYVPPEDAPGQPGFLTVARGLNESWEKRRSETLDLAANVASALRDIHESTPVASAGVDIAIVDAAFDRLINRYDAENPGFGGAPRFPPALQLELFLARYQKTRDDRLRVMTTQILDAMMNGGLYDHVGGGFHRYATDTRWRVPHFEKMLYTQAQMIRLYFMGYEIIGKEAYRRVAEETLAFVGREMKSGEGGFYSAMDAETGQVEGKFYTWTESEIRTALGDQTDLFFQRFGLAPIIEGEGSALYRLRSVADLTVEERDAEKPLLTRLAERRSRRTRPRMDTKIVTAWNAQMIQSHALAARVTGKPAYREAALQSAEFLIRRLQDDAGNLKRIYREGAVKQNAFQEDYAQAVVALLSVYEITGDARWLAEARALNDRMLRLFRDEKRGGFFFTDGSDSLLLRARYPYDTVQPSGNGVAAQALLKLYRLTGSSDYSGLLDRLFHAFSGLMREEPGRFTSLIHTLMDYTETVSGEIKAGDRISYAMEAFVSEEKKTEEEPVSRAEMTLAHRDGDLYEVSVRLDIRPGWHINANSSTARDIIPTTVVFNADTPVEIVRTVYPAGKKKQFRFADQPLVVYEDSVAVTALIRVKDRARRDDVALRALISYQACNDVLCRAPEEKTIKYP